MMLTRDDILRTAAGRDLDTLVARTLGWTGVRQGVVRPFGFPPSKPAKAVGVPEFSTASAAALALLDHHATMAQAMPGAAAEEPVVFEVVVHGGKRVTVLLVQYKQGGPEELLRVPDGQPDRGLTGLPFPLAACQAFLLAWLDRVPADAPPEDAPLPTVGDYEP